MREKKKGKAFFAKYVTRNQALRKLQLSLPAFRRLCILKGIYPREPHKKPKGANKTFYYAKDINFLLHEPLIETFREEKVHKRRMAKAAAKKDYTGLRYLLENRPEGSLHHIIKERYPTFVDAIRELDDALCMAFLFGNLPQTRFVNAQLVNSSRRHCLEFQNYVVRTKGLRKVFLSIKGIYYQAEIFGQNVTWVVPYQFNQELSGEVDFRVMRTFLEFYVTLLRFVNFKLYGNLSLPYPPQLNERLEHSGAQLGAITAAGAADPAAPQAVHPAKKGVPTTTKEMQRRIASLKVRMAGVETAAAPLPPEPAAAADDVTLDKFHEERGDGEAADDQAEQPTEDDERKRRAELFKDCRLWLSREVPVASAEFVVASHGGVVSWETDPLAPYPQADESITHQIGDRLLTGAQIASRAYVQPQWIYDSVNAGLLLPVEWYAPGSALPPHLSPFEEYKEGDYVPEQHTIIQRLKATAPAPAAVEEDADAEAAAPEAVQETLETRFAAELEQERGGVSFSAAQAAAEEEAPESARAPKRKRRASSATASGAKVKASAAAAAAAASSDEESSAAGDEEKPPTAEQERDAMDKMMMPRRNARLLQRIQFSQKKKKEAADKLTRKRRKLEKAAAADDDDE